MVVDNHDVSKNVSQSITNQFQNFQLGFIKPTGIYYSYLEDYHEINYTIFKFQASGKSAGWRKTSPKVNFSTDT